ncbi:MAG: hypothetical protein GY749_05195 [Desulfobacteraceae bacterium]|nr:hypothetical protein [Desulfobacteraceae bacterium]
MPIFILHIPDYLLCLPVWYFQRITASKNYEHAEKLIRLYKNSILFKHEMLYFQLPGLHKFISLFARNKELGIKEAVNRINHLYWFTFQQKQAQKAIIQLGKDKHTAHEYIHFLLEENNIPLVTTLAKTNRLAELYLILSDNTEQTQHKKESSYSLSFTVEKGLFSRIRSRNQKELPKTLEDKISHVCLEMAKEQDHRFNDEIIKSLESAHKFLTSKNLKDFYKAYYTPHPVPKDGEIKYLADIQTLFSGLEKINNDLPKIEDIKQFTTRREHLSRQKQAVEELSKTAEQNFYEPFASIWKNALLHFADVIKQEINVQQGSATLFIELKNKEILLSEQERILYFEISNKGQELAQDISIEIQADSPAVSFGNTTADIQVIESGTIKEVSFPINADSPINTVIRGNITFSDRTSDNKTLPFSFPITIFEETAVFHEIRNPYIVGNPITEKSPLYFGRQDAYHFIDKNIITGNEHHTIVCHGLRRTGKSSLLYKILENGFTDKRLVPVYFDIQGIGDEKDLYKELSYYIMESLSIKPYDKPHNFGEFKDFFRAIKSDMPDKIIVILADEFECLQELVEKGKISETIFGNIRHLMQHEEKLIFLFCGTHKLEEMSADYWSIFFNTAMYLKISYLSKKHTAELITKPVKDQLTYDNLAVEQIYKMTHGQPYLTQLLCRTLVNDLNENKKRNYAGINDVDDAAQKIITQGDDHFSAYIWKESDTLERLLLSAAAEELTHKQLDFISFGDLYSKISLVKAYPKKECADTLGRLVTKDILTDKEGRYSFPVNLLRKWVSEKHPLRLVREESERK